MVATQDKKDEPTRLVSAGVSGVRVDDAMISRVRRAGRQRYDLPMGRFTGGE